MKRKADEDVIRCVSLELDSENGTIISYHRRSPDACPCIMELSEPHPQDFWPTNDEHARTTRTDQEKSLNPPVGLSLPKRRRLQTKQTPHDQQAVDRAQACLENSREHRDNEAIESTSAKTSLNAQRRDDASVDNKLSSRRREHQKDAPEKHSPAYLDDASQISPYPLLNRTLVNHSGSQDPSTRGFFTNAHNFVLNNPILYDIKATHEPVLRWLADSGFLMRGAEFDSNLRDPSPRCHPGTRLDSIQKITHWFDNPACGRRSLWMRGPAAVGKTTIIQTLAESLSVDKNLGASLFFSRPNGCTNPSFTFPTIAYQLSVRIPEYRQYLELKMMEDPKMLEKTMDHQFRILIAEPFSVMTENQAGRMAVLIDGLDECESQGAQIRIIHLIAEFTLQSPSSPLIWVIASRPESHLTVAFQSESVSVAAWVLEVPVDSDDACRDVELFLRDQFKAIGENYPDDITPGAQWPSEDHIATICKSSSGHFGFASTLARFISDENVGDPVNQLAIILSIAKCSHIDPLASLHSLYIKILDRVPKHLLSHLKLLLSFRLTLREIFGPGYNGTAVYPLVSTATLFKLQRNTVYATLRRLHSVVRVPSVENSGKDNIHFYHASFTDLLCDVSKSGEYALDAREYYTNLWQHCFMLVSTHSAYFGPTPPITMAWDVPVTYVHARESAVNITSSLYKEAVRCVIHHLMPSCSRRCKKLPHIQVSLSQKKIHDVFEMINFSQIYVQDAATITEVIALYEWFLQWAPDSLRRSGLISRIDLAELDLTHIASHRLSLHSAGTHWGPLYSDSPKENFEPSGLPCEIKPTSELVCQLEDLRKSNPHLKVVIFGRGPSQSVALIHCRNPSTGPPGRGCILYYIPYSGGFDKSG